MTIATRVGSLTLLVASVALTGACSSPTQGQQRMSVLCEQMRSLASAMQIGKGDVQDVLEAHDELVANVDADLMGNFENLRHATDILAARQQEIGQRLELMDTTTTAYLSGWEADLDRIDDSELRNRSEARMRTVKERLEQIHEDAAATQAAFDPLLRTLRNHVVYLSNDLTMEAAASLAKDSDKVRSQAAALMTALDNGAQAARECARTLSVRTQP